MIRSYESADYPKVLDLLQKNGFRIPTSQELNSYGLVWEEQEKIIGFVWGLTGEGCATVFVDYFVVDQDSREKEDGVGRGLIATSLITQFLFNMMIQGKTRVIGQLPNNSLSESLARIYNQVGMEFYQPYQFVQGHIPTILKNMMEGKHGNKNRAENHHTTTH